MQAPVWTSDVSRVARVEDDETPRVECYFCAGRGIHPAGPLGGVGGFTEPCGWYPSVSTCETDGFAFDASPYWFPTWRLLPRH